MTLTLNSLKPTIFDFCKITFFHRTLFVHLTKAVFRPMWLHFCYCFTEYTCYKVVSIFFISVDIVIIACLFCYLFLLFYRTRHKLEQGILNYRVAALQPPRQNIIDVRPSQGFDPLPIFPSRRNLVGVCT